MRRITATVFVSLDGVRQAPGGPEEDPTGGFKHGGWVAPHWHDAIGAAVNEAFSRPFDLLLGRRTYDIFAAHWPYVKADPADPLNDLTMNIANTFDRITKYVATHAPDTLSWQNSEWLGADVVARLCDLKQQDGPDLLVQGSSELLQTLLANDLIDELRLLIFPIVLGKGKRLFGASAMPAAFRLIKSTASPNGVLISTYERAGAVETGSFEMEVPTAAELERRKTLH